MRQQIRHQVSGGVYAIDEVLFYYFYCNRIVQAEHLQDAWNIFNECYREKTRRRIVGSVVVTLRSLEQVMYAIQDILEIWEWGPPNEKCRRWRISSRDVDTDVFRDGRRILIFERFGGLGNGVVEDERVEYGR